MKGAFKRGWRCQGRNWLKGDLEKTGSQRDGRASGKNLHRVRGDFHQMKKDTGGHNGPEKVHRRGEGGNKTKRNESKREKGGGDRGSCGVASRELTRLSSKEQVLRCKRRAGSNGSR